MRARIARVLFLAYVAGDLANPMMPGAFQVVQGIVDVVEAVSARTDAIAPPALLPAAAPAVQIRVEPDTPVPDAAQRDLAPRVPLARRALARSPAPPPPTEDH
jgi:hypothetical protein